jgi:hypothetical protein
VKDVLLGKKIKVEDILKLDMIGEGRMVEVFAIDE